MHSYGYTCGKFYRKAAKMCIILLISKTTENSFFVLPMQFLVVACNKMNVKFVQISQPATEQVLRSRNVALETLTHLKLLEIFMSSSSVKSRNLIFQKESELEHVPGSEKRNVPAPGGQKDRSRRSCPTSEKVRSSISSQALQVRIQPSNLSRSLIQLGKYGLER